MSYTIGCASSRAFHPYIQIRGSLLVSRQINVVCVRTGRPIQLYANGGLRHAHLLLKLFKTLRLCDLSVAVGAPALLANRNDFVKSLANPFCIFRMKIERDCELDPQL